VFLSETHFYVQNVYKGGMGVQVLCFFVRVFVVDISTRFVAAEKAEKSKQLNDVNAQGDTDVDKQTRFLVGMESSDLIALHPFPLPCTQP